MSLPVVYYPFCPQCVIIIEKDTAKAKQGGSHGDQYEAIQAR